MLVHMEVGREDREEERDLRIIVYLKGNFPMTPRRWLVGRLVVWNVTISSSSSMLLSKYLVIYEILYTIIVSKIC